MDLNSVKKRHFASVLPQLLSTHLTSGFNIRWVQIWLRTFPLCIGQWAIGNRQDSEMLRSFDDRMMRMTNEQTFVILRDAFQKKNCPEWDIVLFGREGGKINPIYLNNHKWDTNGREGGSVSCLIIYIFQRFACQQGISWPVSYILFQNGVIGFKHA